MSEPPAIEPIPSSPRKKFSVKWTILVLVVFLAGVVAWAFFQNRANNPKIETIRTSLVPFVLEPLPLGSIKPTGWLLEQLKLQAGGLSGHLDEFWPDISQSGWIGGKGEGWERGPYWLDGVIPLAYELDDAALKLKIKRWVDTILKNQQPDGWLGPDGSARP